MDILQSAERLAWLCDIVPALIEEIDEDDFTFKPNPTKWSKKEILGHLIDSAANNHQRFIRVQFENEPVMFYDQNQWNELTHYNSIDPTQLIRFWKLYNLHLLEIIRRIPTEHLAKKGTGRDGQQYTLKFYIDDYVDHMEHHLRQIIHY